ncbi:LacI family DNA-binding transcriptional regulator [Acuticoccus sp. MNP-M23]|uniref:LacI family DNA-binding transcriptional regulator n=1 Tax=Acuticoccus sp. MNP-M23 TaxID=3072793 RepID=UPI0028151D39|nr:LacI family DNA-binding transcriptional regulator [Acuticoccus sp. MNP-M23]WMS40764.1 LacI family DNA-binding transcriptional regulator [Acuticoccus sp. MNP-M23]
MSDIKIKNMEEFASVAGVSRPTISKYFNDPASVRHSTRKRIEGALARYDYRPNIYAINQNRRLTKTIGIMVPQLVDPFFAEIARSIECMCIAEGFRPLLLSSHGDVTLENENLDTLRALKPAGALIAPLGRASDKAAIKAICADVPTVIFDSEMEGVDAAFIGSNNDQSIALIVDHLCRTGEPPCFFEMATPPNPNALKRHHAFRNALNAQGLTPHIVQAEGGGWDFEGIGLREGSRLIRQNGFATNTVLCSNDRLAIGLIAAAYENGLRVGAGSGCAMRIAGHDDHPFARYTCPALTTVSQEYDAIAARSFETLFEIIDNEGTAKGRKPTLFDGRLVLRQSA